jgi:hypothetical protein
VALDEVPNVVREGIALDIASKLYLVGDLPEHIVGPMLQGIEGHHPNWGIELASHEIGDDGLKVCPLDLGLALRGARREAVHHEIDRLIGAAGHHSR